MTTIPDAALETACEVMHDAYEAAATTAGWETQESSRKPWADVPEANKATMRVAVRALIEHLTSAPQAHEESDVEALGEIIWTTSRADEGTISATGANIIARNILEAGWVRPSAPQAEGDVREFADFDALHEYLLDLNYNQGIEPEVSGYDSRGIPIIAFLTESGGDDTWPLAMVYDSEDAARPAWSEADLTEVAYPVRIMSRAATASGLVVQVGEVERLRAAVHREHGTPLDEVYDFDGVNIVLANLRKARKERDDARFERDTAYAEVERMMTDRDDLRAERDAALAAVEAVRAAIDKFVVGVTFEHGQERAVLVQDIVEALESASPSSSIPARLLSGVHRGREVVLPDGTTVAVDTIAHLPSGRVSLHSSETMHHPLAPDDVVTLVDEETDQ